MTDVMQMVTDQIIEQLEMGVVPWHKPWCSVRTGAFNRFSGRRYSLLNQLILGSPGEYGSFDKWSRIGGRIKKLARSQFVVFWKWPEKSDEEENSDEPDQEEQKPKRLRPILRYYRVFHISQVDGVDPLPPDEPLFETEPIEAADNLLRSYIRREGIRLVEEVSNEAYYAPGSDKIHIPDIKQFEHPEEYYSTAIHEAIHSTGHAKRLGRFLREKAAFGSETYSKEELIAEIGSAAILNMLGIESEASKQNSAAYIGNWLRVLKGDKRFIVSAAGQAEKAVQYITGQSLCG